MVDLLHQGLRWLHVLFGFVGLAVFWAPLVLKKGGANHIRAGRIFVWCALVVGFSAAFSSAWALLSPMSFLGAATAHPKQVRFFFAILGVLSLALIEGAFSGIDAVRLRRTPERIHSTRAKILYAAKGLAALALTLSGVCQLAAGGGGLYWIHLGLGALFLADAFDSRRKARNPLPTPMAWWYRHMEQMIGCGIAFHTAFFVFGAGRLFNLSLEGPMALLPWVMPAAIGLPAIAIWIRRYKRRFGELTPRHVAATPQPAP